MNRDIYEKILAWMNAHRDEIVSDIVKLASIKSVSTYDDPLTPYGAGAKAALDEALKIGEWYGFKPRNYEDRCGSLSCLSANHNGIDSEGFIDFWGHLDVVPEGGGWLLAKPFEPIIKDGHLIGRGVEDNKGPTVAVMSAMRALRDLGVPLKHSMRLFLGCDEEHGMTDCVYFTSKYKPGALSIIADSEYPVNYGEKGILEVDLSSIKQLSANVIDIEGGLASNIVPPAASATIRPTGEINALPEYIATEADDGKVIVRAMGKATHSSKPHMGENAIGRLTDALINSGALSADDVEILRLPNAINSVTDGSTLGIAMSDDISGPLTCAGTMICVINGYLKLRLNIRYCISKNGGDIFAIIKEAAQNGGYEARLAMDSAPSYYPKEKPLVAALTNVYNEIMEANAEPFIMAGGTYARKLPNALGFGIGIPGMPRPDWLPAGHGGAHEPDEAINIDYFLKAATIFAMGIIEADSLI